MASRTKQQAEHRPQAAPAGSAAMRRVMLLLLLAGVAASTWAFFEFVVWNRIPAALVGKWEVLEGPDAGGTVDFYRHGRMVAHVNNAGKLGIIDAKIRVTEDKIFVTTTHRETGAQGTRVQTIKSQEGDRLVLQDEKGNLLKLRRTE